MKIGSRRQPEPGYSPSPQAALENEVRRREWQVERRIVYWRVQKIVLLRDERLENRVEEQVEEANGDGEDREEQQHLARGDGHLEEELRRLNWRERRAGGTAGPRSRLARVRRQSTDPLEGHEERKAAEHDEYAGGHLILGAPARL